MTVALLSIELFLPMSQSLKDKRMVLRRVKDRLKKFNVAVSEVDHQDLWQRGALAIVTVSTDQAHAATCGFSCSSLVQQASTYAAMIRPYGVRRR